MGAVITDKDKGMQKILKELRKLNRVFVKVGILSSAGTIDGVAVAQYATWNENGVAGKGKWKIPPRPFIKGWATTKSEEIKNTITKLYGQVASGQMSANTALNSLGVYAKSGIQAYIRQGNFVPNSPVTIMLKGSSKPLIDTGTMRNNVNYEVTK